MNFLQCLSRFVLLRAGWRALALMISMCAGLYAQEFRPTNISTFNLKDYGWQPAPREQHLGHAERPGTRSSLVSFDHSNRVLFAFTIRETVGLAAREEPGLSLRILRLTSEGNVDLLVGVPTRDYFTNGFYLGSNDQIVARANDSLYVLTENNKTGTKDSNWQVLLPCPIDCYINASFSRRTLIVRTSAKRFDFDNLTYSILDTSSFPPRIVQTCSHVAHYAETITDKFAYWDGSEGRERFTRRFPLCDLDHPEELSWFWGGGFFPLNDDAFLLLDTGKGSRGVVRLVGFDGRVKFQRQLPNKNEVPQYFVGFWATADERGDRFAFTADTWRGGSRVFDTSGKLVARRIVVYDETGRELASIPVSTNYHRDFDFALSPDGHRLAILDNGVLTVAELRD